MQAARHEVHSRIRDAVSAALMRAWLLSPRRRLSSLLSIFGLISCLCLSGCATLTIPAIDPSGNRIFSSTPTQLTLPQLHGPNGRNLVPNSSFPEPPPPAACLQGPVASPPTVQSVGARSSNDRGRCGQILLTPTRIVAPVGGEVVLIAGVCGEDGYLVSGEPIEWMLAPDSVGEIIEVGDDMKGKRRSAWGRPSKPVVEKLDVDFARGRTSAEAGRITRGSLKPTDDLVLKKGQTWVSLTSPTEGSSRVTVLAPDSDVWDRRRQTATIYWVDASWQFPPTQQLRVGETATLITQVKRKEGFVPAEGWIVKYRLMSPDFGQFLTTTPSAEGGVDKRVDADAKAIAQLGNPSNKPGTAIVSIEIVRPAEGSENMPALPIARGQTMISWSAPLLELKVTENRDVTMVGEPVDVVVTLANAGDMMAENVRLVMDLKNPGLKAEYSQDGPPPTLLDLGAIWDIGVIPARRVFEARIRITPAAESDNRIQFNVTSGSGLSVMRELPLLVVKPSIELKFGPVSGMEQVEVGSPAIFKIIATNQGRTSLSGLSLLIDTDAGLQHAQTGLNRFSADIPYLAPGKSQELGVQFIVRKIGDLNARLIAQVGGIPIQKVDAFVRGIEAKARQSSMVLKLQTQNGSPVLAPNAETLVTGIVQNLGQTNLTNIQMVVDYESSLGLTNASPGINHRAAERQITWPIQLLEPGNQLAMEMQFRLIAGSPPPVVRITARSAEGVNAQETLNFSIASNSGGQPPVLPSTSPDSSVLPPVGNGAGLNPTSVDSNAWLLAIAPIESNVRVGEQARYSISFQNRRSQPDQGVALEVLLPQGVQVLGLTRGDGTPVNTARSDDGRVLRVEPIQFLRNGEAVQYVLALQHDNPGSHTLEVQLRSAADPQGVRQQSRITVRPNL